MTSRISYSKLSRENRKRMLGMTIVTVLTFFIKAVFEITVCHSQLIKIAEHRKISAVTH